LEILKFNTYFDVFVFSSCESVSGEPMWPASKNRALDVEHGAMQGAIALGRRAIALGASKEEIVEACV
jgi:hypothetical protein